MRGSGGNEEITFGKKKKANMRCQNIRVMRGLNVKIDTDVKIS
jgi:hypothetical protein